MKVLIIHFRSGPSRDYQESRKPEQSDETDSAGTDGVSLEIMKREIVLKTMGHQVAICSAYSWADFPIPALEYDSEEVMRMMRNLFGHDLVDFAREVELKGAFDISLSHMSQELDKVITHFSPSILFIHNILSLPVHPAATVALTEIIRETKLPCAGIHHDILSEGTYKFTPTCNFAKSILEAYFPPVLPNLRHWTINSRNQKVLRKRGIDAKIIPDTMDFSQMPDAVEKAKVGASLRREHCIKSNDIVLLVGARVVPNKQIELAGHLTAALHRLRQVMIGRKLYNGEVFVEDSRIVLVVTGRPERAFADYQQRVFQLFDALGINWIYVGNRVHPVRPKGSGFCAVYPDYCPMADFVLYPSIWEGFGSMLLRSFTVGLPAAVFQYPVFKDDIAPTGVRYVSLGDSILNERDSAGLIRLPAKILNRAAHEIIAILTNSDLYTSITEHNFNVGRKYFSFDVLRNHLHDAIAWAALLGAAPDQYRGT